MAKDIAIPESDSLIEKVANLLLDLLSNIPDSGEPVSAEPAVRAHDLTTSAALAAAALSAGLALPPGPFGLLTILPDLLVIWRIQARLVADIAAVYGKTAYLTKETMLYCLFRHAAAQAVRDIVVRTGKRILVRRASLRASQALLRRTGVGVTQRAVGRGVSRFLPPIGAGAMAAYAYYDTRQVGNAAIEVFSRQIGSDGDEGPPALPPR